MRRGLLAQAQASGRKRSLSDSSEASDGEERVKRRESVLGREQPVQRAAGERRMAYLRN